MEAPPNSISASASSSASASAAVPSHNDIIPPEHDADMKSDETQQQENLHVSSSDAAAAANSANGTTPPPPAVLLVEPLQPSLYIPPNVSPAFASAITNLSSALHARTRYQQSVDIYNSYLARRNELSIQYGATPEFSRLVIEQQRALKMPMHYELVHAYSIREGEIRQAEEVYTAMGREIPSVERERIIPEIVRFKPKPPGPTYVHGGEEGATPARRGRPRLQKERVDGDEESSSAHHRTPAHTNPAIVNNVRTLHGLTDTSKRSKLEKAAAENPLLYDMDRRSAYDEHERINTGGGSALVLARSAARRNGSLLPSFALVYSSFISSLGTWFNTQDLAARVRQKENSNFVTWVECFGYRLPNGDEDYEKLSIPVKKDLDAQWKEYVWRGIFPPGRTEVWNKHLKKEKLRIDRDPDNRRLRMVPLPGWVKLETDTPDDPVPDSSEITKEVLHRERLPKNSLVRVALENGATLPPLQSTPQNNAPANNPQLMQMMLLMQQQRIQQGNLPAGTVHLLIPNQDQQTDILIDKEYDTIDGDLKVMTDPKEIIAETPQLVNTASIPPVAIPCRFLPTTISKIGGQSIFYLILYAHINQFVSSVSIRLLAKIHFPASWNHFYINTVRHFPPLINSMPLLDSMFEKHITKAAISTNARTKWNESLSAQEGVQVEALSGPQGSFYRLVRVPAFQRPAGSLALADRLMASLRVTATPVVATGAAAPLIPTQPTDQQQQPQMQPANPPPPAATARPSFLPPSQLFPLPTSSSSEQAQLRQQQFQQQSAQLEQQLEQQRQQQQPQPQQHHDMQTDDDLLTRDQLTEQPHHQADFPSSTSDAMHDLAGDFQDPHYDAMQH